MTRRLLAAICSGAMLVLSFAPFGLWPLAFAAFVPILLAIDGEPWKRRILLGFITGLVFFLGSVYWVVHSMHYYGGLGLGSSVPVMVLLSAYLALFFALFTLFAARMPASRLGAFFFLPALWVGAEFLRGHLFTGFPWVLSGYALTGSLVLMQSADLAGVLGLSFIVMLVNAFIYLLLASGLRGRPWPKAVILAVIIIMAGLVSYGVSRIGQVDSRVAAWPTTRMALAQGSIDQSVKWDKRYQAQTLGIYSRLTARAAQKGASIVIWPETAVPFYLVRDRSGTKKVRAIARQNRVTLLTGSPAYDYNGKSKNREVRLYNSAYVISRTGAVKGRYDKVHLVPYGEYVPLKRYMPFIKKLTAGTGDFASGPGPVPLVVNGLKAGVLICYEAIFPELAREEVRKGASVLVNITNDAWFGKTSAPYQHLEMARLRAVENRTFLLRAANTGISAIIDPAGRIKKRTELFTEDVLTADVGLRRGPLGLYTRYGDYFAYAAMAFAVLVIVLVRKKEGV